MTTATARLARLTAAAPMLLRALRLRPPSTSLQDRLAMLPLAGAPLQAAVEIRWNDHQVPFICAENDADLATALGIVHAHLRGTQIELMRRVALGRTAEVAGPLALEVDRALHLFDFGRTTPAVIAMLPPATRAWAEAFVRGINHVVANGPRPPELAMLDVPRTAWTLPDLFTLARLCATDVSWIVWARLLRVKKDMAPDAWAQLWPRLLAAGAPPLPGVIARGGSNSAAVAASRSTGGARIASDPHLGTGLPNLWLLAGLHAPGFNAVGLMLPGLPFIALGRNQHIAWGGTNLHAASSDLVDVSALPPAAFTEREVVVPVRGKPPATLRLRETEYGPVVTDGMILPSARAASLRWVGHHPSDELTAMLAVNRATGWEEFRTALEGFAIPGQNMVYADTAGSVGHVIAAHLPPRPHEPPDMLSPPEPWGPITPTARDRFRYDPAEGFIASANDSPGGLPVGYFFAPSHRADRLRQLLGGAPVDAASMRAVQTDVQLAALPRLHGVLIPALRPRTARQAETITVLRDWDGRYDADSRGALAWELLLGHLVAALRHDATFARYSAIWTARLMLTEDIARLPPGVLGPALALALRQVTAGLRRYGTWGGVHRVRLAHPLARLPGCGRFAIEFPAPGSNDTLDKRGHGLITGPVTTTFGACARHVSDLEDPDANEFLLLGGQDGWLGSSTYADQVTLWRAGRRMTLPLRPETARASFPYVSVLQPG